MKFKLLSLSILTILLFTACSKKEVIPIEKPITGYIHTYTLNDTVEEISKGLARNLKKDIETGDIAITTFVELKNFKKTSKFGRLLSESLFNDLFSKGVNLLDFRSQTAVSINAYGEYFLSRKIKKLNKQINSTYILIGTYSQIDNGLAINARIVNNHSGNIITTSSVLFHTKTCKLLNTCKPANRPVKLVYTSSKKKSKK